MEETKKTGLATAGLVVGIIGIVLSFIPIINNAAFVLGVLALIFGIVMLAKKTAVAKSVAAIVLGILAVVVTLVMQNAALKAVDEVFDGVEDSLNDLSGENTDAILEKYLDVTFGQFTVDKKEYFSTSRLPMTVKNKGDEKKSFIITVEAVDQDGKRLESDVVYVNDLRAGQSQDTEAFTLVSSDRYEKLEGARFQVVEISMM